MKHKAVRVNDLMYKGCEPHWKCVHCGDCVPFHCYSKEEFENMECKEVKKEIDSSNERESCPKYKELVEVIRQSLSEHIGKSCLLTENIAKDLLGCETTLQSCIAIDDVPIPIIRKTVARYAELEELYLKIKSVSGIWPEEILEMLSKGYTLQEPETHITMAELLQEGQNG